MTQPHSPSSEQPAPEQPDAAGDSPARRRGRFASTLLAGALAGAAVAAPVTLLVGEQPAPAPDPAPAAAEPEATPVTTPTTSGLDVASVLDAVRPSVVAIRTETLTATPAGLRQGEAAGSGFVVDPDGTIVTNSHVVDGARDISVEFADGTSLDASLVAQDPSRDLAVLSVDADEELTPLEFGSSADLNVGDPVVAIGNALGLEGDLTVTTGIVSAEDRDVPVQDMTFQDMIQTDAAINPGNSGGPLVDAAGRVVGINSAAAKSAQSIGFAIPIDQAAPVIESLADGEVPARPFLGVRAVDLSERVRAQAGIERRDGVLVLGVTPGSGAENAGVRVGDVITRLADHEIADRSDLADAVADLEPDESVDIGMVRDGEGLELSLVVGSRPGSVA